MKTKTTTREAVCSVVAEGRERVRRDGGTRLWAGSYFICFFGRAWAPGTGHAALDFHPLVLTVLVLLASGSLPVSVTDQVPFLNAPCKSGSWPAAKRYEGPRPTYYRRNLTVMIIRNLACRSSGRDLHKRAQSDSGMIPVTTVQYMSIDQAQL